MSDLSGTTLAIGGAIASALVGAVSLLFRQLMAAKDAQLAQCEKGRIEDRKDRDWWRDFAFSLLDPADKALGLAEHEIRRLRRP